MDVLKPFKPSILEISKKLSNLKGIEGVDITLYEMETKYENIKITIQGYDILFEEVQYTLEKMSAAIHSIDKVTCGKEIVKEAHTHQDSFN